MTLPKNLPLQSDVIMRSLNSDSLMLNQKPQMPIQSYQDFYRFYLTEHHNLSCRRLHFLGSSLGLLSFAYGLKKSQKRYFAYGLLAGYTCAWIGHFVFEKNKPASFKQPLYSFISDWRMYYHIVTGQISLTDQAKDTVLH